MTLAAAAAYATAAWTLDEASGSRADSVGSSTLSDNNTVTSGTGMFGNAAQFTAANLEWLSVADSAAVSVGDVDWLLRFWVKFTTLTANQGLVTKRANGTNREYGVQYEHSTARLRGYATSDGSTFNLLAANTFGAPSTGTWCLVHFWHDATNNQIGIAINGGTADTTAHNGGVFDGTSDFAIGRDQEGGEYANALIDDVVILKGRFLDATERTSDYNGGAGVPFAAWASGHNNLLLLGVG